MSSLLTVMLAMRLGQWHHSLLLYLNNFSRVEEAERPALS